MHEVMDPWRFLVTDGVLQKVDPGTPAAFLRSYPDGAYTTTRTANGASVVLLWQRHLARLAQSVLVLASEVPVLYPSFVDSKSKWQSSLAAIIDSSMEVGLARALGLRKDGEIAVTILACGASAFKEGCANGQLQIHFSNYNACLSPATAARLAVMGPGRSLPMAKFSAWARDRQVLEQSRPENITEVLLSNNGDMLLEGSITNFFVVAMKRKTRTEMTEWDGIEIQTAPLEAGVLPGVIRRIIVEICRDEGIRLCEVCPSWMNRHTWREAFITSSLRLVQPVISVSRPASWNINRSSDAWKSSDWETHDLQVDGIVTRKIHQFVKAYAVREGISVSSLHIS